MKLSQLAGKPVIVLTDGRLVGFVDEVLVEPSHRRIAGLRVRGSRGHERVAIVPSGMVRALGRAAVTVVGESALQTPEQVPGLAAKPSLGLLLGRAVVSSSREQLGSVVDVELDPTSGAVSALDYAPGPLLRLLGRRFSVEMRDVAAVDSTLVALAKEACPLLAA
jgi:sporulation protein YlmC with PRC-barrel domain